MEEKRRHSRYTASEMAFVVGLENPGLIIDVSEGGLGVRYNGVEEVADEIIVDLINAPKSIVIEQVRCRKVRDETVGKVAVFSYVSERRLGLEFLDPTPQQISALVLFRGPENLPSTAAPLSAAAWAFSGITPTRPICSWAMSDRFPWVAPLVPLP